MAKDGNDNLKAPGTDFQYTPAQLQEMMKSAQDIEYFAEHYCHIVTLDNGKQLIKLRQYQKDLLGLLTGDKIENDKYNVIVLAPRQSGKCVVGDSDIRVRNKKTKEIIDISIEDFHKLVKK